MNVCAGGTERVAASAAIGPQAGEQAGGSSRHAAIGSHPMAERLFPR